MRPLYSGCSSTFYGLLRSLELSVSAIIFMNTLGGDIIQFLSVYIECLWFVQPLQLQAIRPLYSGCSSTFYGLLRPVELSVSAIIFLSTLGGDIIQFPSIYIGRLYFVEPLQRRTIRPLYSGCSSIFSRLLRSVEHSVSAIILLNTLGGDITQFISVYIEDSYFVPSLQLQTIRPSFWGYSAIFYAVF
jgi:hypothetical protein